MGNGTRKLYQDKEECYGCYACHDICKANAIKMARDREGFFYPEIDKTKCTDCGACTRVCPVKNPAPVREPLHCYGARNQDENERYSSSSGGFFPVLAKYILDQGGVVFGACMDQEQNVRHIEVKDAAELAKIKKTKYVQSNLENVYSKAAAYLRQGREVLFCGTPCQCDALRNFIKTGQENLFLAGLICFGVPSPGLWKDYVRYLQRRYHGKLSDYSFRDKKNKDSGHTVSFVMDGTREYTWPIHQDNYLKMYFKNCTLRPSCYRCPYTRTGRSMDFTIGDFWGIEKAKLGFDDKMGTSVILLHTAKAETAWEEICGNVLYFACEKEDVLQPRLQTPTPMPQDWKWFRKAYGRLPFPVLMRMVELGRKKKWI